MASLIQCLDTNVLKEGINFQLVLMNLNIGSHQKIYIYVVVHVIKLVGPCPLATALATPVLM